MASQEHRYDVFLSHNSTDKPAVQVLADRLRATGLDPFLDTWHLIPGTPWQEGIEQALEESASVAVFVGPSGISPWHNEEMREALDRAVRSRDDYRVIPVLLPGADPGSVSRFLARRVWVDFRTGLDDDAALQRLAAGVKGEAVEVGSYELPDEPAPYRGLLPFEAEHARFFFGREVDIQRLLSRLAHHPFLAVVGASGSGKSSLVKAGLLPRLGQNALPDSYRWQILALTPGSQPLRSLASQLATLAPAGDGRLQTADLLTDRLQARSDGLRTAVAAYVAESAQPVLLFIDQFEELFTLCTQGPKHCRDEAEQLIANLSDTILRNDGLTRIAITLRADFLDRCLTFPALRDLLQAGQYLLGPMTGPALREAIVRPGREVGAYFEKGLVGMILREVEQEPGALPLLQHSLYELWRARRGPWLTIDAYEASGGVSGALQRRAQATYDALTSAQQAVVRSVFIRLTSLGEGAADTRRRVRREALYPANIDRHQVDTVLGSLADPKARLIVADVDSVEIAHEALIQSWPLLRRWLEENRDDLRTHRRLMAATEEWEHSGRDESYLYRGARLVESEEWAVENGDVVNASEADFLKLSVAARDRAAQLELATARRLTETERQRAAQAHKAAMVLRLLVIILAALALVAPSLWIWQLLLKAQARGPMVCFDASETVIGSNDDPGNEFDDYPATHIKNVGAFCIERYEVTNHQYKLCVRAKACSGPVDRKAFSDESRANHPVTSVTAYQAEDYCTWLGRRLPSELEWETTARGSAGRLWPWEDEAFPESTRTNLTFEVEGQIDLGGSANDTVPVGSYPEGTTPEGVHDLVGNVWEWTATPFRLYSYFDDPSWHQSLSHLLSTDNVVQRGGAWNSTTTAMPRVSVRVAVPPGQPDSNLGFRCAKSAL